MDCKFILTSFGLEHNMYSRNLKLHGQFKFELYDLNKNLIKSSDWIDNFITNSGVSYPYSFAFADCFRFLSVGSGTTQNSVNASSPLVIPVTTGLSIPIPKYSYIGSRTGLSDASSSNYSSCGFLENPSGVTLMRQWTLPDNKGDYFTGADSFYEFMVSPGRPYVTGLLGKRFCGCEDFDNYATGLDCSTVPQYYRWASNYYKTNNPSAKQKLKMCDADKAFARVKLDTPFSVVENSILNIAYQLNVIVDTGINFNTLSGPNNLVDPNWNSDLNLYGRICQMGVKLINDGTQSSKGPTNQDRLQHYDYTGYNSAGSEEKYSFLHEYGESFIPPLGMGLEPSNIYLNSVNTNTQMYLADDNRQFLVSSSGGRLVNTGDYAPWNNSNPSIYPINSGLMGFFNNNRDIIVDTSYWDNYVNNFNIRRGSGTSPSTGNVTISIGASGNYYDARTQSVPTFSTSGTRGANVLYSYLFDSYAGATPLRTKNIVVAYKELNLSSLGIDSDPDSLVPFFDSILSGTGTVFIPNIITGIVTGVPSTGAYISGSSNQDYYYVSSASASAYPKFSSLLGWSVPCEGANGC